MTIENKKIIRKGGMFIIQDDGPKGTESTYLALFTRAKEGEEWMSKNQITTKISNESPDFIFNTPSGKIIGLEITNFIVRSNEYHAAKHISTATLYTIGNQVCQYFKKKGIALSIVIDIWDPRKWSVHWSDILEHRYDPGFKDLDASNKEIKDAIIKILLQKPVPSIGVVKESIDIGNQTFCISADRMHEPYTSVYVNNEGACKKNPFEELQATINSKNDKYEIYKNKCNECDLLVVSDDSSTGNFATFTDELNRREFISVFRNVYLLDLGFDTKVTKLKTQAYS